MTVAISIILGLIAIAAIGYPWFKPERAAAQKNAQRSALTSQADLCYVKIQELELDFERGSTSREVYDELKRKYEEELAAILGAPSRTSKTRLAEEEAPEDYIERQVRELRQARGGDRQKPARKTCPDCGAEHKPEDRFCSTCGASLASK